MRKTPKGIPSFIYLLFLLVDVTFQNNIPKKDVKSIMFYILYISMAQFYSDVPTNSDYANFTEKKTFYLILKSKPSLRCPPTLVLSHSLPTGRDIMTTSLGVVRPTSTLKAPTS